jgi:aminomethyltransferase
MMTPTPLHALHVERGARLVPFAGYEMPVQYPSGIIAEHNHTRRAASLFDVSHMGQLALRGEGGSERLEALVPGDIAGLAAGRMRYTVLTNDDGGILDDLMVTNVGDYLFLVVNAARRDVDIVYLRENLPGCLVEELDRALIALQGPAAASVLDHIAPGAASLAFMQAAPFVVDGVRLAILRSGYTGEDGFEITIPAADAERIARLVLDDPLVEPAGLGARDSLRLEAGLCLYGNDIDEKTTLIEAGLSWVIAKRRRSEGGFPGADLVLRQLEEGGARRRVGILLDGRAPARAHAEIRDAAGGVIGEVTSGGFGPTVGRAIAMGYVSKACATAGTVVSLVVRDRPITGRIVDLPFVPHRYYRN